MNYSQKNYVLSYIIPIALIGVMAIFTSASLAFAQETTDVEQNTDTATTTEEDGESDVDENADGDYNANTVIDAQRRIEEVRNNVLQQRDRLLSPLTGDDDKKKVKEEVRNQRADIVRTQAGDATTTREEVRADRAEDKAQRVEERAERAEERRSAMEERVQERINAYIERLGRRFNAAITRLEGIAERIESRIEKLNVRGIDTSEAERELDEAYTAIALAQSQVDAAIASLGDIFVSDSPREAFNQSRATFQSAKEAIRDAHGALVESIALLKASIENRTDDASDDE